jgi:excisionase family DNA binding protein
MDIDDEKLENELLEKFRLIVRQEIEAASISTAKKMTGAEEYLTRQQVADRFAITLMTCDSWVKKGKLKAYRIGTGRKIRFKSSEIDACLKPINVGK